MPASASACKRSALCSTSNPAGYSLLEAITFAQPVNFQPNNPTQPKSCQPNNLVTLQPHEITGDRVACPREMQSRDLATSRDHGRSRGIVSHSSSVFRQCSSTFHDRFPAMVAGTNRPWTCTGKGIGLTLVSLHVHKQLLKALHYRRQVILQRAQFIFQRL